MQTTKKQHYVWRFYLKPWTDDNQSIACCRNDKIFRSNLMGIGQENYFYKFIEISDDEAWWIEKISLDGNEPDLLQKMCLSWVQTYRTPYKLINALRKMGIDAKSQFEKIINEGEEKLYCKSEEIGLPYFEKLYSEDLSFYDSIDGKSDFNIYICDQFFRTKKRQECLSNLQNRGINLQKLWPVFRHIFATKLAFTFTYSVDKKFNIFLLHNRTEINFITGDQPVINRYATKELQGKPIDKFEFYYPLTPKLAILLTEKKYTPEELTIYDTSMIIELNDLIFYNSQEQIYGLSEIELERYKTMSRN